MWAQPMGKARRSVATPRRSSYHPPTSTAIHELLLSDLLVREPSLATMQRPLVFDQKSVDRKVWCCGDTHLLNRAPSVAIVGTRAVSPEGAARARRLARQLAEHGVVVVSGLAKGVDTEALKSAMAANGHVAAVIGTPVQKAYPIENAALQEEIAQRHLLVSPFAPGTRTFPNHFPERNRIMAAVSDATVIIEASDTSGTLHQAAECVRLDRWLFIAKNVIDDQSLTWPARFLNYNRMRVLSDIDGLLTALKIS